MTVAQIRKRLAELERLEAQAANKVKDAEARLEEGKADGQLLIDEITSWCRDIKVRRPGAVYSEATARELTRQFAQKLLDDPIVAVPANPTMPQAGDPIRFENRAGALLLGQYQSAYEAARQVARDFRAQHGQTLRDAERGAVMARYRAALEGDDPYELAAAQRALPTIPDVNTLTTQDL